MKYYPGAPSSKRTLAISSILVAIIAVVLDVSMFNSALRIVAVFLEVEAAEAVWLINVYQITMLFSLLAFSSIAEKVGNWNVFIAGLLIFVAATISCGMSQSLLELGLARGLQGVGASALTSINLAMIQEFFPSGSMGRGFGLSAFVAALSMGIGPLLTPLLLNTWQWQSLFFVPLSIALVAFVLTILAMPAMPAMLSVIPGSQKMSAIWILMCIPDFAKASIVSFLTYISQSLVFTALPFFIYSTLHKNVAELGFLMMVWSLMVAITALIGSRLGEKAIPWLFRLGMVLMSLAPGLMAFLSPQETFFGTAWLIALSGAGFGLFQAPNICMLLRSVPEHFVGSASGIIATSRMAGQLIGSLLLGLFFFGWDRNGPEVAMGVSSGLAALACAQSFSKRRFS